MHEFVTMPVRETIWLYFAWILSLVVLKPAFYNCYWLIYTTAAWLYKKLRPISKFGQREKNCEIKGKKWL